MKKLKQTKGITLIALIITIIILLILAMVTIKILINDGIIGKAREGVDNYTVAEEKEQIQLGYSEYKMQKLSNNEATLSVEGATVEGEEATGWTITFSKTGNAYTLSSEGTIEKQFNAEEWDKKASDEDCFIWKSDDSGSEDYGVVIGYTEKINNYSKLVYPSRCTKITFEDFSDINGIDTATSRSYTNNIKQIEIPGTVTEIGGYCAFGAPNDKSFQKLETVNISKGLTSIGSGAFQGCANLNTITIPDSVTSIGEMAFFGCTNLRNITIPNSVISIGGDAFYGCTNLRNITIPNSVISIGGGVFSSCTNLSNIEIPNSVTSIGNCAFFKCTNLSNIEIPNSVTSIGERAFQNCTNLSNITIPNSVTSIGEMAFFGCTNLRNITIQKSVTSIGVWAFEGWTSNQTINCRVKENEKPQGWDDRWNENCYAKIVWGYTGD